jgi:putative transposase
VSKQAYYKYDEGRILSRVAREEFAAEYARSVRAKDRGIGGRKLWHMYRRDFSGGAPLGRDRFEEVLDRCGLKIRTRVRKPRTTDSSHGLPVYPNLVRDLIPEGPDRLWVSDITYVVIWTDERHYTFCYLSLVLDAYSEEVVGWSVCETLDTDGPLQALLMALKRLDGVPKEERRLIHHSDRGCQYASARYVGELVENRIGISMTESGDPKDNAKAERINSTVKNELLRGMRFCSAAQVASALRKAVPFYNNERPHMSIDMMTPAQAARHAGEIRKRWRSRREEAIRKKTVGLDIPENSLPLNSCQGVTAGKSPQEVP